jgi:hypothetical protein
MLIEDVDGCLSTIQPVKAFQRLNSLHAIRGLDDLETLLRKGFRHESPNQKSSSTRRRRFPGMVTSIFTRRKSLRSRI